MTLDSPVSLDPILHDLEQSGCLTCHHEVVHSKRRKAYRATNSGESCYS